MNVGATSETDYGNYFMWGSTTSNTASECTWSNAPFNNGSSSSDSSYFNSVKDTVCPNGILAKEYDTASKIMGGDWRMPTKADFQELFTNATSVWVDNYNNSNVNGWKITSKTDTSKYIFIPAAGTRSGSSFNFQGIGGGIWSSSLDTSNPNDAWCILFDTEGMEYTFDVRYKGLSVRGVL